MHQLHWLHLRSDCPSGSHPVVHSSYINSHAFFFYVSTFSLHHKKKKIKRTSRLLLLHESELDRQRTFILIQICLRCRFIYIHTKTQTTYVQCTCIYLYIYMAICRTRICITRQYSLASLPVLARAKKTRRHCQPKKKKKKKQ